MKFCQPDPEWKEKDFKSYMENSNKQALKKSILRLVREEEPVSRTRLQKVLRMRLATITEITHELIDSGYIVEGGIIADKKGKKKLLYINRENYRVVGIDLTRGSITALLTDLAGGIVAQKHYHVGTDIDVDTVIKMIVNIKNEFAGINPNSKIMGMGISFMGSLDRERKTIVASSHYTNFINVPIREMLEKLCNIPVLIDCSNNLYLLAEKWFGCARQAKDVLYVEISEGIATGIIAGGRLIRGFSGIEGELGHTIVNRGGEICVCGNRGCLETVASSRVIVDKAKQLLSKGAISILKDKAVEIQKGIEIDTIYKAAGMNDRLAISLLSDAAEYIGVSVANIINITGPEMVIFGGFEINKNNVYTDMLINETKKHIFSPILRNITFGISDFGSLGSALGGTAMILSDFYCCG